MARQFWIPKQLFAGAMPTAVTNEYTVPVGQQTWVKEIVLCNTTGAAIAFAVRLGGVWVADGSASLPGNTSVPPNGIVTLDVSQLIAAGTVIALWASAAGLHAHISGLESNAAIFGSGIFTPANFVGLSPMPAASTVEYTVPANTKALIKQISIANNSATTATTVTVASSAASIFSVYNLGAGTSVLLDTSLVLEAAQTISVQNVANTASADLAISGVTLA